MVQDLKLEIGAVGFHRSAGTLAPPFVNLIWVGDQKHDWTREDGLRSTVSATIHYGMSGFGVAHSDIGGYTTVLTPLVNITRSAELLGRWGEVGALSGAVFRSHEGLIPSVNVQSYTNDSTFAYFAYNARLFKSLRKYRRGLLNEAVTTGRPLVRHPLVYFPLDPRSRNVIDEV